MSIATVLALAVALGTDAFSMCLGLGMAGVTRRQIVIVSLTVLVFHIFMPLLGWYAGEFVGTLAGRAASIAGALLLVYLGVKMIRSVWKGGEILDPKVVLVNTWGLLLLAASVSMDALSVGFTLGTRQVDLPLTAGVIGVVAGVMTAVGLVLGRFVGARVGERAVLGGGVLLVGIGVRMIVP
ncbi:manganese efflux pump MntP family protein [Desulfoscipio geothermicus]|uniref:Putative manganese efflux pump MntP n=1 Tax=Desulfoscipio geothermicus DSM 3669 TaxID=1121426 RepID=A0A1I6CY73_9FIRM|nr:manganese efflux pump MntP family protein [Desulfoscipio geothermicus]SFQ98184.1 Putative Mn2+ efflux pump MntP [Desulfoscipio geothermicus DSM 3669]